MANTDSTFDEKDRARRAKLSAAQAAYMANLSQEKRAERYAKVAAAHRGRKHPWAAKPDSKNIRTNRERAVNLTKHITACQLAHIGGCGGMLDRAHIDQDPTNNAPENIMVLCRSHHRLHDHGWIDLANPVMPRFYTDASGKRRYRK